MHVYLIAFSISLRNCYDIRRIQSLMLAYKLFCVVLDSHVRYMIRVGVGVGGGWWC